MTLSAVKIMLRGQEARGHRAAAVAAGDDYVPPLALDRVDDVAVHGL
jgi:hypothetical protein